MALLGRRCWWRGDLALRGWWWRDLLWLDLLGRRLIRASAAPLSTIFASAAFTALAAFATTLAPAFSSALSAAFTATALTAVSAIPTALALVVLVLFRRGWRCLGKFDQRRLPVCRVGGRRMNSGKGEGN